MNSFEPADDQSLEMRLQATADAVPKARRAVGAFAAEHGLDRGRVELAVAEAVANAVLHGFLEGAPGEVVVRAWVPGRHLRVEVSDNGLGVRNRHESPGLGLGLPLIEELTREFTVGRRGGGGTVVSMEFERAR